MEQKSASDCDTKKKKIEKHPAVNFYWDVIHKIWHAAFLNPKQIIHLRNYLIKLSPAIQDYQRFTFHQDTHNYCLCDPHALFDFSKFSNVLRSYAFPVKIIFSLAVILKRWLKPSVVRI